jgi:FkbM family methyltransferase
MKIFFDLHDKPRRNVLVTTDHGLMIVNRFDCNQQNVGQGQWLLDHGSVASVEAWTCIQALRNQTNPVIFDIGANIGNFTTWLARAFPLGRVHAIEPQRAVFQILTGNVAINNFYNVWTHNCAISDCNDVMSFDEPDYFSSEDFGIFSLVQDKIAAKSGYRHTVDVYSLDWFVEHFNIPVIDLIKIDAEGMDLRVLQGGRKVITTQHPVIFIEHCDNQRSIREELETYLKPLGYDFVVEGNNLLCT